MDDNELDRLFGNEPEDTASDTEAEDVKTPESESSDEAAEANGFVVSQYEGPEDDSDEEEDGEAVEDTEPEEDEETEEESEESEEEIEDSEDEDTEDGEESSEEAEADEKPIKKTAPAAQGPRGNEARRRQVLSAKKSDKPKVRLSGRGIFAICLVAAIIVMVILVLFLPAFRVRNAHIEGNIALSDEEILNEIGLEYDAHLMSGVSGNIFDILCLNYGKTEERIKKENPYIEDIRISVKLPSTVNVQVKERSKVCYIRTPDGYAALDRDGIVLELSSFDSSKSVRPVICGLNVTSAELGKKVQIGNMNDYKKAVIVLGAILAADNASVGGDYSMFENTSEVRILPSGYIFLTIYSPSGHLIQIKLNSTETISDDMAWLLYLFNADAFDKITVNGALDMTDEDTIFKEY